jgi:hypothetical protein
VDAHEGEQLHSEEEAARANTRLSFHDNGDGTVTGHFTVSAATVVVTISADVLQGALKAAHLDTGQTLSAGEARRLACTAGIIPAVLGTGSVALDLGRESRLFSLAQRVPKDSSKTSARPMGANGPMPGASSTTGNPGRRAGGPT